jgi:hypothetical protein
MAGCLGDCGYEIEDAALLESVIAFADSAQVT